MTLELVNNLTKNKTLLGEIEDKNTSALFYNFDISLTEEYEDGEYTYRLFDGENIVASGLIQIGDFERDTNINKEYNDNKTGFIVYGE